MTRHTTGRYMTVVLLAGSLVLLGGCASKKMVRDGMSSTDRRIGDIESQIEANQRDLRDTGRRLDDVASDVRDAERAGMKAGERADAAYNLAKGKLLYKVVLDDTAGTFAFESAKLSDDTKRKLDELGSRLKQENANVYLEIAGHTDSSGPEGYNLRLGLDRAEAVRRYLNAQHEIPLHRMSVISHGESQPLADNATKEGRARNRRVEIRVLS